MNVQALIDRTRALLMTGKQDRINELAASITADAMALTTVYDVGPIGPGATLSIGLEDFHVMATAGSAPGSTITVHPHFNGTPSSSHNAGDIIRVNAQFSDHTILMALHEAVTELVSEGCFYVKPLDLTYNPSVQGYPFTATDFLSVYRVRYDTPGPGNFWPPLRATDYYTDVHSDTTDFPGGKSIVLRRGGHSGQKVRISYRARFGDITTLALTDDVSTIGIHPEGQTVLPYCAATHAMAGREVKRNFSTAQVEPRRAEEVPPGAVKASSENLERQYYKKLQAYRRFLHRLYPMQI